MNMLEIFSTLHEQGINLQVVDNNLKINAPRSKLTPALVKELKERKEELIKFLQNYVQKQERYVPIESAEEKEYYVLSPSQRRLYLLQQLDTGLTGYNMPTIVRLEGYLDRQELAETFKKLIARHEILRTSFCLIGNEPVQQIYEKIDIEIEYYDKGDRQEDSSKREKQGNGEPGTGAQRAVPIETAARNRQPDPVTGIIEKFIRPFNLLKAPLLRVGLIKTAKNEYILMMDMHHIISDGTSMGIFVKEFMTLYNGQIIPGPRLHYKDFAEWFNRREKEKILEKSGEYWLKQFAGEVPVLNLPEDFPRPVVQSFAGDHIDFRIDAKETSALKTYALESNTTLFGTLVAVFTILLSKLSGQEDIVVGAPTAGRKHEDLSHVIGMFVNTLALRNFPDGEKTFKDFVLEVGIREMEAFENQEYPFEELVEKVAAHRDASRNPLFDVMLAFQDALIMGAEIPGLKLTPYPFYDFIAKFDLIFICQESGDYLNFTVEYSTGIFREKSIKKFINYFKKIVFDVSRNNKLKIGSIEIISDEEKQEILHRFNNFEEPFVGDKTIHRLFGEQAQRTPHNIALVGSENKTAELQISFKKLAEISGFLAGCLQNRGAQPGDMVGIVTERSVEMIFGIMGILKAGCAYVPLNPKAPAVRNLFMLKDCYVKLLLTTRSFSEEVKKFSSLQVETMFIEEFRGEPGVRPSGKTIVGKRSAVPSEPAACNLEPVTSPSNLAYVIYTSGSTGMPKGVAITHNNFCQLVHWGYRHLRMAPGDRALQNLSYYFDWSVWEIFVTLTSGVSLYMVTEELLLNPEESVDFMNNYGITILHVTPTQYQYIVNASVDPVTLRFLFIGAEKLTYDLVKRCFASVDERCRVFNQYGPTEATIISAVQEIHRDTIENYCELASIPIGTPTGNTCLYVMDRNMNLCPVNLPGELYISGEGVAAGYLNNPELTAEKFINLASGGQLFEKSWTKTSIKPLRGSTHQLAYCTGDLTRWLPDGSIEYMGRIDQQVKIRGFRIELGEVESNLLAHDAVKDALVIDREDLDGEKYLCAYIVYAFSESVDLKEYLSGILPDYMVPSYFMQMERIPLNPNGKADRKALPLPDVTKDQKDFTAPRNELEKKLTGLWADILGIEQGTISIDSNFFDLGGHSLKANLLVVKIDKVLNVKIPLTEVFTSPTIRELADVIAGSEKAQPDHIPKVEAKEYYPLSQNQQRLYILHQLDPQSPAYNMPGNICLDHAVDEAAVARALNRLITRHESFRTMFKTVADRPCQFLTGELQAPFEIIDISTMAPESKQQKAEAIYIKLALSPFDLSRAPLFRVKLVKLEPEEYQLMFNIHHIISDGWSLEILKNEFLRLYEVARSGQDTRFAPLLLQYKDFAQWHNRQLTSAEGEESSRFWKQKLTGGVPILRLPVDEEVAEGDTAGAAYNCLISLSLKELLKNSAAAYQTTLFNIMFSVYIYLLHRITGQEDIVCSVIAAGRNHPSLQNIIGFFVNSVIFRVNVDADESFEDFIHRISRDAVETFRHQSYPLELVFEELGVRYPDIPVSFNLLHPGEADSSQKPEIFESFHEEKVQDVKFDLEPYILENNSGISLRWVYKKNIFHPETIEYIVKRYTGLLEFFAANPGSSLNHQRAAEQKRNPRIAGQRNS